MSEQNTKGSKKIIFAILAVVLLIAAMVAAYFIFKPGTQKGAKAITIEVVNDKAEKKTYEFRTDAEYLVDAMEEAEGLTFEGTEGDYGLYLNTVNGLTADYAADGAYWSLYVNGSYGNYGVSDQPVIDGEVYTLQYERYVAE